MKILTSRKLVVGLAAVLLVAALTVGLATRSSLVLLVVAIGLVALTGLQSRHQTRSLHRAIAQTAKEQRTALGELSARSQRQSDALRRLDRKVKPSHRPRASGKGTAPAALLPFAGDEHAVPAVTLVLDTLTSSQLFAGVKTAILVAAQVAARSAAPLRIAAMHDATSSEAEIADAVREILHEAGHSELAPELVIGYPRSPISPPRADGIVVVTYWRTAHAIGELVTAGQLRPDRVIYLVQDFEPGFYPWGTDYALAEGTYSRGFRMMVNSAPLADHVRTMTGVDIPHERVFAPLVDTESLRRSAEGWSPSDPKCPRLLFYARPSKPRNLFPLGVDALRRWVDALPEEVTPHVVLAGERAVDVDLPRRATVEHVGHLTLAEYHRLLSRVDLGLALMFSPHPSHLPLELPMAGIPTVTNQFGTLRRSWVPGLEVADADAAALAEALERTRRAAETLAAHHPQALPGSLGVPVEHAVAHVVDGLTRV